MKQGKIIATAQDRLGQPVNIRYVEELANTPVLSFFLRQMSDLIERGHAHQFLPTTTRLKAVYCECDGQVVAHIVFEILDQQAPKTAWITLSAVADAWRRRGLYTMMHEHFEEMVIKMGCGKIASFVHVDNVARQLSCEQVGMVPVYYRMEKDL